MNIAKRLGRILHQQLWQRSLPHGLFSWHYLRHSGGPEIQVHRRIFLTPLYGAPRSLWWLLQAWLCLKCWLLAWRHALRAEKFQATRHQRAFSWQHWRTATTLAMRHGIPPATYYSHRLYEPEERTRCLSYLYDVEGPGLHHLGATRDTAGRDNIHLLADKWQFYLAMRAHGIPVTETTLLRHDIADLPAASEVSFLKPRFGSRSEGAFSLYHVDREPLRLRSIDGTELVGDAANATLQTHLRNREYLCQPLLRNHPTLASLTTAEEAISLRVITLLPTFGEQAARILCAYLEVPVMMPAKDRLTWFAIGINRPDGKLLLSDTSPLPAFDADLVLPYWPETQAHVIAAHRLFPNLRSIAWDIVITPEGPALLEGNFNWRLSTPQQLFGPFGDWAPELFQPWQASRTEEGDRLSRA